MGAPYFPEAPAVPTEQRAAATPTPRYEDVAQDGRFMLTALPVMLGEAIWRGPLARAPSLPALLRQGVLPILARLYLEASDEPVPAMRPLEVSAGYALAHDGEGAVERVLLNAWAEVHGQRGRTHMPPAEGDGARVHVGRVFAEHVFTRPFAEKGERKVVRLVADGLPEVPPDRHRFRALEETLALPQGATPRDRAPVLDDVVFTFGLAHTDSNQHVNSLVYLRLFEEALVRRAGPRLARWAEIAYRKPCFAGDRVRVSLALFERAGEVGAVGTFIPADGSASARPIAYVRMGMR